MDRTSATSAGQEVTPLRCTVYARTSSHEVGDQAYTSIDAQLDAGRAYINSQAGVGWQFTGTAYSDADVSGAVLERPGLQRLMAAIEAGKVDVVVVLKLDRISRSVRDFSQMMGFFDQHGVALVSVTQHLNSGDSLGRLAINTLMSFAEFERDIASERSRDKLLATRRKGLWSGSVPPLGYVLNGQRLVIQEDEAALVRTIFERFVALQSVSLLAQELTEQGVTTKTWITRSGKVRGGKPIDKTYIYKLLNNRILIGELQVEGDWHPATHESIVDQALWDQAQALLSARRRPRKRPVLTDGGMVFLLRGRVFGEDGRAYSPWTSSVRGNRIYRYYVPQKDIALGGGASGLPRLQAFALEQQVMDHVYDHLKNPARVLDQLPDWMTQHPEYSEAHFSGALTQIAEVWPTLFQFFKNQMVLRVLDRVTVHTDGITVRLYVEGFVELIREFLQGEGRPNSIRDIFDRAAAAKPRKPRR
jgi:DNA invertase Pin-like site-specific DNA recombinase